MSYDISELSKEAKKDFAQLYKDGPDTVESLCDFPGEIGRLAQISVSCGKHYSH